MYVRGLREEVGQRIASAPRTAWRFVDEQAVRCPGCGATGPAMLERVAQRGDTQQWFCNVCARAWYVPGEPARFRSLDHFVSVAGARRDELATLAGIGALNAFGYDRRAALWQIEQAVRPAGELYEERLPDEDQAPEGLSPMAYGLSEGHADTRRLQPTAYGPSPLSPMTPAERVVADYLGTGLTIGPHPVALRRADLAQRGVLRAMDLPAERAGRRVRIAGAVITRQRPGTAKGFCFLTIEDETGIANVIVRPDLFDANRHVVVREPFILVEGVLQQQDGVTSVRAERVMAMDASTGGRQSRPAGAGAYAAQAADEGKRQGEASRYAAADSTVSDGRDGDGPRRQMDLLPPIESHDFH
jgi:error-prone DNA polymerase